MVGYLQDNSFKIAQLCKKYHVSRLEIFGSASQQDRFGPESDFDFLVEFGPIEDGRHSDMYFGLLEELEATLGRHVDLVVEAAIRNPYFKEAISKSKQVVYAA